jgi:hypothetical protein
MNVYPVDEYNRLGLELMKTSLMEGEDFYRLGTGSDFDKILTERYQFFQGYLDGPLQIDNAIFIFGSKSEYNGWASGGPQMNVMSINAHLIIGNTLFYKVKTKEIEDVLIKYGIALSFDSGLETTEIMRQTAEMYIFYHETGHLIQAKEPSLISAKRDEKENTETSFDITSHIAELDADMFANVRIASHVIKIISREKDSGVISLERIESLCSIIVAAYLTYRNLILANQPKFYTKKHKHPHLQIRMFAAISDISNAVSQNTDFELRRDLIVKTSLNMMDDLCEIHPQIAHRDLFITEGQQNIDLIREYYQELLNLVTTNKCTVYAKRNGYQ